MGLSVSGRMNAYVTVRRMVDLDLPRWVAWLEFTDASGVSLPKFNDVPSLCRNRLVLESISHGSGVVGFVATSSAHR